MPEFDHRNKFHKLAPKIIRVWQISNALGNLFWIGVVIAYGLFFGIEGIHFWGVSGLGSIVLIYYFLSIFLLPALIWRNWRYSIDKDEIELKSGVLIKRRTLVPLKRVQHVDTTQGPFLRWFSLSKVTISTAATTHEIPGLDVELADRVRRIISKFARLAEEDV